MPATPLYTPNADFTNATITVTSTQELNAALASLSTGTGGTILVDGSKGPYQIEATNLGLENKGVLITALDEDVPPHVEQIDIRNASDITVHGMKINSVAIDEIRNEWDFDVNIVGSKDIEIVGNDLQSDADGFITETNGVTEGERAILIRLSENVKISHNTIEDYRDGITYLESTGLELSHNEISGIQGDGMRGGGVQDLLISNNYMHDFHGSSQTLNHSDMIQIWGTNTDILGKNIEISNNILDAGDGAATQSILIQNEDFSKDGLYFDNISIHGNVIHNAMGQGIGTKHVTNLEVYDNTVLWNMNAEYQSTDGADLQSFHPSLVLRDSPNAEVYGNIVGTSELNGQPLESGQNYILDYVDEGSDNYAGKHFVNFSGHGDLSLQDLSIRPDSALFGEFGAETSSDLQTPMALEWMEDDGSDRIASSMMQSSLAGRSTGVELSAKYTLVDGQMIDPDTAKVTWFFDDGTSYEGLETIHVFDTPGMHEITLEIEVPGGETASITRLFEAQSKEVFDIDFNAGGSDTTFHDSLINVIDSENDSFVWGRTGKGFELDGNDRFEIDRTNEQFTGLKNFNIDLGFKMQPGSNTGNLVQLHKAFTLEVSDKGALTFDLETTDGTFQVTTDDGAVKAGTWADISVQYDGFAGKVDLVVDGDVMGSSAATGTTTATTGHSLVLGAKWSTSVKGIVDNFTMTTPDADVKTPLSDSIIASVDPIDAMMDEITAIPDALPDTTPPVEVDTATAPVEATTQTPPSDVTTVADPDRMPVETQDSDTPPASDVEEDDDTFLENIFDFIKEIFGISSDEPAAAPLDLAPFAQHGDEAAFSKAMALFEMVPNTGLLPETSQTDGEEGEEDEDPAYNLAA